MLEITGMYRLRIKEIATAKGFSISRLSRLADVPVKSIRRAWHDPQYQIQLDSLSKIAKALGVSINDLLEDVPDE